MQNRIIPAPESADTGALFAEWSKEYTGTVDDFYHFITTPTAQRDLFLRKTQKNTPHP